MYVQYMSQITCICIVHVHLYAVDTYTSCNGKYAVHSILYKLTRVLKCVCWLNALPTPRVDNKGNILFTDS